MQHELFDAIICPGGLPGAKTIAADSHVKDMLKKHEKAGKIVAAICAGPLAIKASGIFKGKQITSYPSFKTDFESIYTYNDESTVVIDGNLITRLRSNACYC